MSLLPEAFWDAFDSDRYLDKHEGVIAFNIEKYADLIEGKGYARTLYNHDFKEDLEFFVNIIAIKDCFFLSLHQPLAIMISWKEECREIVTFKTSNHFRQ